MSRFIPSLGLTESESNFQPPRYINIVDRNTNQFGGADSESSIEFSVTSTDGGMVGGGAYSLTSENMVGGGRRNYTNSATSDMVGGSGYSITSENMVGGGKRNYSVTSNSATSVMAGGSGYSITSSMIGGNRGMSATSDFKVSSGNVNELVSMLTSESEHDFSQTNTEELEQQLKGIVMEGGNNPGFKAFLDLKKHVATKLGISNGPKAAKVAGAVQKATKAKNPDVTDGVKIAELGKKAFDANMDKYKKML